MHIKVNLISYEVTIYIYAHIMYIHTYTCIYIHIQREARCPWSAHTHTHTHTHTHRRCILKLIWCIVYALRPYTQTHMNLITVWLNLITVWLYQEEGSSRSLYVYACKHVCRMYVIIYIYIYICIYIYCIILYALRPYTQTHMNLTHNYVYVCMYIHNLTAIMASRRGFR